MNKKMILEYLKITQEIINREIIKEIPQDECFKPTIGKEILIKIQDSLYPIINLEEIIIKDSLQRIRAYIESVLLIIEKSKNQLDRMDFSRQRFLDILNILYELLQKTFNN